MSLTRRKYSNDKTVDPEDISVNPLMSSEVDFDIESYSEYSFDPEEDHKECQENKNDWFLLRWKRKIRHMMHSKPFQISSIALVILDCILVLVEIIMDLYMKEDKNDKSENIHEDEKNLKDEHPIGIHEILPYFSLAILSIFVVERITKILVDFHHFITHKMEVLDAIIVMGSFTIDVTVLSRNNGAFAALGLIVILRLWRVVRIVNGIIVSVKKNADHRVHAIKHTNRQLEHEINRMEKDISFGEQEIMRLKQLLDDNKIEYELEKNPYHKTSLVKQNQKYEKKDITKNGNSKKTMCKNSKKSSKPTNNVNKTEEKFVQIKLTKTLVDKEAKSKLVKNPVILPGKIKETDLSDGAQLRTSNLTKTNGKHNHICSTQSNEFLNSKNKDEVIIDVGLLDKEVYTKEPCCNGRVTNKNSCEIRNNGDTKQINMVASSLEDDKEDAVYRNVSPIGYVPKL